MLSPAPVSEYLDALSRALRFDPALAHRVRREAEAHLWDAAIDESPEAQRRAVERFGDVTGIANEFAVLSASRQLRRLGITLILAIAGVFLAMRARLAWYGMTHAPAPAGFAHIGRFVALDRWVFLAALGLCIISWAWLVSRPSPVGHLAAGRKPSRFGIALTAAATCVSLLSVLTDVALTGLRFLGSGSTASVLVPLLSILIEAVCAAMLIVEIRKASRRASGAAALSGKSPDALGASLSG